MSLTAGIHRSLELEILKPVDIEVLDLISQGQTNVQVCRELEIPKEAFNISKAKCITQLGAASLPGAVHLGIERSFIEVENVDEPETAERLDSTDRTMLGIWANGGNTWQIAEALGMESKAAKAYNRDLLKKVGAWSTAHAVRRAHEINVLTAGMNRS